MRNFNIFKNFDFLKNLKFLFIISFVLGFSLSINSFSTFSKNIETLGTDKEWKFYASLAGFTGFSSMLFMLIISSVILLIGTKLRDKLNNAS